MTAPKTSSGLITCEGVRTERTRSTSIIPHCYSCNLLEEFAPLPSFLFSHPIHPSVLPCLDPFQSPRPSYLSNRVKSLIADVSHHGTRHSPGQTPGQASKRDIQFCTHARTHTYSSGKKEVEAGQSASSRHFPQEGERLKLRRGWRRP